MIKFWLLISYDWSLNKLLKNKEKQITLIAEKNFNRYSLVVFIIQFLLALVLTIIKKDFLILLVFLIELALLVIERTYSKKKLDIEKKAQRDANFTWLIILIEIGIIFLLSRGNESTWLLLTKFVFVFQIISILWGGLGIYLYQGIKNSKE